jgi:hypothetical protein
MLRRVAPVRTDISKEFYLLYHQADNNRWARNNVCIKYIKCIKHADSVFRLLVTANNVPIPPIIVSLKMEAIPSSETRVFTRAIRRNVPEDDIL